MTEYEQIVHYLDKTCNLLAEWLNNSLTPFSNKWWKINVVDKLSYAQRTRVIDTKIESLDELDLRALLRVFDQNWYELSNSYKFTYEQRNYLKEMVSIRNRWAHKPVGGYDKDDIYRDFDTIQRFLALINTDKSLIEEIKEIRNNILSQTNNVTLQRTSQLVQQSSKTQVTEPCKAKNLAIRVPWQDNGWSGHLCTNPQKNTSCLHLKRIAEEKDVVFECTQSGKVISKLTEEEIEKLPCLQENSAFLSNDEYIFYPNYPYKKYKGLTHVNSPRTPVLIKPYSLISRPFRWLMTKLSPAQNIISGYCRKDEDDFKAIHKNNSNYPIGITWINEPKNQKAVIEYYYDGVSDKSLLVPYLKNVPFTDNGKRIALGVGYVKKIYDNQHYNSSDSEISDMPIIWDRIIQHDFLNNGFIFPYKELFEYWKKHNQPDIDDYILFVDDEYRDEFSYGSEPVSYDALLSILKKAKDILLAISRDIPEINYDFISKSKWIDNQIARLKTERGIFPAIGTLFLASDNFKITVKEEEVKNIALDILKHISFDGSNESVEFIKNAINESQLSDKFKEKAKIFIKNKYNLMCNLSRFNLTEEQFRGILNDKYEYTIDNPYLLFENSLIKKDEFKIPLNKIDNGLFFEINTQKTISILKLLDADSKERLRAFLIRELDEQAQNNGHPCYLLIT